MPNKASPVPVLTPPQLVGLDFPALLPLDPLAGFFPLGQLQSLHNGTGSFRPTLLELDEPTLPPEELLDPEGEPPEPLPLADPPLLELVDPPKLDDPLTLLALEDDKPPPLDEPFELEDDKPPLELLDPLALVEPPDPPPLVEPPKLDELLEFEAEGTPPPEIPFEPEEELDAILVRCF